MKVTKSSKYTYAKKNPGKKDKIEDYGKMRALLIIICFINIFLYYAAYSYFDNILAALAKYELPVGLLTFIKYFIVFVLGFLIGLLVILGMRLRVSMNYFDIKVLLLAGFLPAFAIILSYSGLVTFLINTFFSGNETISELYYYFFSRTDIWALWLGVATGASIRLKLMQHKRKYKHQAID
jgi:hypothetical protein